jgi:hypothetical protein
LVSLFTEISYKTTSAGEDDVKNVKNPNYNEEQDADRGETRKRNRRNNYYYKSNFLKDHK